MFLYTHDVLALPQEIETKEIFTSYGWMIFIICMMQDEPVPIEKKNEEVPIEWMDVEHQCWQHI